MTWTAADVLALEDVSARAWPAARQAGIGGWRLNAASGFSGRINACWPLEDSGLSLDEAVAAAEAWYADQGLPPLFKIVESACAPTGLSTHLAALGYRPRTETLMMVGPASSGGDGEAILTDTVEPLFAAVFAATATEPGDTQERLETLARIPQPRFFVRLDVAGEAAAIGACGVEGDQAGIFAMRTNPAHRRQGLARRVLRALIAAAAERGVKRMWLQVEADNPGAIALYQGAGFVEAYRYRYWPKI